MPSYQGPRSILLWRIALGSHDPWHEGITAQNWPQLKTARKNVRFLVFEVTLDADAI